jgi:hypothetical protein
VISKNNLLAAGMAIGVMFAAGKVRAISLDDIQLWAGSGTNRAALVIEWSVPESLANSTVPVPVADKALVWGYRFNGTATGTQMLGAILVADPKLYVVETNSSGTLMTGFGYNLNGNGHIGITDGTTTNLISRGVLTNATVSADAAYAINDGDLYWSGFNGPRWETWTELGDAGGFSSSPNRGQSSYWMPVNATNFSSGSHGQWSYTTNRLDTLQLTNGSWIGFSVAAGECEANTNSPYNQHKHAPVSPDGTYVAYVPNTNDFAAQVNTASNLDTEAPYDDPTAMLGEPTLRFYDPYDGNVTDRVSVIDPPFNVTPAGSNVITEIENGGEVTVEMGRKIYASPNHPYGADFIVYGNSLFDGLSGVTGGFISDKTDLSTVTLTSSFIGGHAAVVSVSQDGTNWFTLTNTQTLFPAEAYRWDDTNSAWTTEEMNANKPLNPLIYTNNFAGQMVAGALDQFVGASGGSEYNLQQTGLPWIQYVCIQPAGSDYAVVDAIAAVNPVVVGDALSIAPDNIAAGITNLFFQRPDDCDQNEIAIGFRYVNEDARISTVSLHDFTQFAPVEGTVSSAYQIQSRPVTGTGGVIFGASVGLRAGDNYTGKGNDLRVFQWSSTNWVLQPFTYDATNNEVTIASVTNFSAFVVSQIVPPSLGITTLTNGFAFQFAPVPNCPEMLQRTPDLETWTNLYLFTATNAQPIILQDTNAPAARAFYRIELNP